MAATGSVQYYQDLINTASGELSTLRNTKTTLDNSYAAWLTFKAKGYKNALGREVCQNCCGRQQGQCSAEDNANIDTARLAVVNQQKLIDDKIAEIATLQTSLQTAQNIENAKTPAQRAEEKRLADLEAINQRKNRTWVPVLISVVVIAAIVAGIYFYRRNRG